jgi:SsrA-binding protein
VADNRRARRDYEIGRTLECGMELVGSEVKALRDGRVSISDAWAMVQDGQLWLVGLKINRYAKQSTHTSPAQGRTRRLLAHRDEIEELGEAVARAGCTLVPLQLYFKGGWAKVLLGVGAGKTWRDKRDAVEERDAQREMARAITRHAKNRTGRPC